MPEKTKTPPPENTEAAEAEPLLYPAAPQSVIVLPLYHPISGRRRSRCRLRRALLCSAAAILAAAAVYLLWPSDPELSLVRLRVNHVKAHTFPLALDLSLSLTLKVRNRDFFSLDYRSLVVSIGYRGRELGFVRSDGGELRARGSSYVEATLDLNGIEIAHDVIYLLEDLAKGLVPFDTDTKIRGDVGLFFVKFPLKARVSCEVYVNISNQTISHQDCSSE